MSIVSKEEWTTGPEALGVVTPAIPGIPDPVIQMSRATPEIPDPVFQTSRATPGIPDPVNQMSCASLGISELETRGVTGGINTGLDDSGTMMNNGEKGTVIR